MTHPGRPDGNVHVTISAGIAHSQEAGFESVMALADQRLYQSKASGRNCVTALQQ
ncbi:MAG: diguanylate cyclase domain-containing protein [Wenzhouxiangella sp.]